MATLGDVVSNSLAQADAKKKAYLDADLLGSLIGNIGLAGSLAAKNPVPWLITDQVDTLLKMKDGRADEAVLKYQGYLDLAQGKVAKAQVQSIAGVSIGPESPMASKMFQQMADMGELSAMLSGVGIFSEIVSLGQIDRCSEEIRRYLDMSGATQLVNYGYGLILERMIGDQINHELNALMQKGVLSLTELTIAQMRREGFDPERPAWDNDLAEEILKYGLNKENAERLLKVNMFYPGPNDWIRFAVRDVFNPSAIAEGKLDDAFPDAILEHSRAGGVSDEIMKWFWRAHWQLPSPTMLYEMLHRRIITVEQAREALRTDDWAPGWIPRLIEMSYNPLTRVDARRMFESGTLSPEQYKEAMMDLGYSPENAELFLKWATTDKKTGQKDLTMAQVQTAHDLGLNTDEELKAEYLKHGYDEDEAQTLIDIKTKKEALLLVEAKAKLAMKRFTYKKIEEDELKAELLKLGIAVEKVALYVEKAKLARIEKRKLPSKDDLVDWLKKGIIDRAAFGQMMAEIGYTEENIERYSLAAGAGSSQ